MTTDLELQEPPDPGQAQARDDAAEAQVLGAVLVTSGAALDDLTLTPSEFYRPAHAAIYAAMLALHGQGSSADPVSVAAELRRRDELARAGGPVVLADLMGGLLAVPSAITVHARMVRECAARRAVVEVGTRLQQRALAPADDPMAVVEDARAHLDALAERVAGPPLDDLDAAVNDAIEAIEAGVTYVPTPWADLNRKIGGWRPGAVYVIAARPGGGKSIIGLQAALDVSRKRALPALVQSMEMTRQELLTRALSQLGSIDSRRLSAGGKDLTRDDWDRVADARGKLADAKLVIDDRTGITPADIRARARGVVRRYGQIGLIVVDYLQLMTSSTRVENRQTEVAAFSRAMKVIAKDLHVPVLLLSQLNRRPAEHNRPPQLSDLRESGAIEQDCDVAVLLHRDEDDPGAVDRLDVAVAKNRNGPTGALPDGLMWQGHYFRVSDPAWSPSSVLDRGQR